MVGQLLVLVLVSWTTLAQARTDLTRYCKFFYTNNDTDNRNLEKIDDAFGPGCIGNGGNLLSLFPCTVDVTTGEFSCPAGVDGQRRGEWAENTIEPPAPTDPGQCFFYFLAEQFCIKCFGEVNGRCLSGGVIGATTTTTLTSTTVTSSTTLTTTTTSTTTTVLGFPAIADFGAGVGVLPGVTTTTSTTSTTLIGSTAADFGAGVGSLP